MRFLPRSLVGTFILILLAGGLAMAADPAEPATPVGAEPVAVSGTLDCGTDAAAPDAAAGTTVNVHQWAASDPRLEGEASYTGHWQLYPTPAEDSGVPAEQESAVYSIVNEGGSWLCEESRTPEPPSSPGERQTLIFTGQGEYEGLTAYLEVDLSQAPYAFSGLILPGDAPPYAEPQG
jgi:hypothetical protein